ncbi:uncharacterized protein CLUP02_00553 [Colletotrichum lupini]|uniref:Heterokaryon incompatibility domain-containing protein n=1 Tax=Colletotrichum lupini TaxID=145971 RepID=A0A9Q8SAK7_9PEZI|nr:uncharacterized protein CLUP02_00553 [Colletotrichum lupini]UQC73906.1 hypothetical protein CLUP02_00553 [Colletotrichum lupini]
MVLTTVINTISDSYTYLKKLSTSDDTLTTQESMSPSSPVTFGALESPALCERCHPVLMDDSIDDFIEEESASSDSAVTLRHKAEGEGELIMLGSPCQWRDSLPSLPVLAESSTNGCHLCTFIREHIIKRGINYRGDVYINGGYIWGADRDVFGSKPNEEGLVFWRCEVYKHPEQEFLAAITFNIESDDDNVTDWLRVDDKRRPRLLDPANVDWIKYELKRCQNDCDHVKEDTGFIPTRLIDVGSTDLDVPRLVTSDILHKGNEGNLRRVEYATLSYCWGSREDAAEQLKTTRKNLSEHLEGIPLDFMSPVVKDTAITCRALGLRYLWVDALCIIQGDIEDWNSESLTMGRVYYCSTLTICPLASASCLQGYLGERAPGLDLPFQSKRRESVRGTYTFFPSSDDRKPIWNSSSLINDLKRAVWETRGWTFQENMLSTRLLFIGPGLWHFACENGSTSENSYVNLGSVVHGSLRPLVNIAREPKPTDPIEVWRRVRNAYARWEEILEIQTRSWSYRDDLLAGIAGLAEECAKITEDTYLAGLWMNDLQHGLVWEMLNPDVGTLETELRQKRDQKPYVGPSWSWVSQLRPFEVLPCRRYNVDNPRPQEKLSNNQKLMSLSDTLPTHVRAEYTIAGIHMDLQWRSPFGRLNPGSYLRMHASLSDFPSDVNVEPKRKGNPPIGYFSDGSGLCMFDWSVNAATIQQPGHMKLLLTSSCCYKTNNWGKLRYLSSLRDGPGRSFLFPEGEMVFNCEDWRRTEQCSSCKDSDAPKTVWGLIVHPADRLEGYYRVGIFLIFSEGGHGRIFATGKKQDVLLL